MGSSGAPSCPVSFYRPSKNFLRCESLARYKLAAHVSFDLSRDHSQRVVFVPMCLFLYYVSVFQGHATYAYLCVLNSCYDRLQANLLHFVLRLWCSLRYVLRLCVSMCLFDLFPTLCGILLFSCSRQLPVTCTLFCYTLRVALPGPLQFSFGSRVSCFVFGISYHV